MKRMRQQPAVPTSPAKTVGCYHAESGGLNRRLDHLSGAPLLAAVARSEDFDSSPIPPTVVSSLRMPGSRTREEWIAQYATSHQHPVNRACHTLGIPTIIVSIAAAAAALLVHRLWIYALGLFILGWIFQFIGHAFEGKPPEFLQDWRFLFVGIRWWWAKIHGKA
jgi:hypothetical protein